jgi:predicted nuclease of predicted toxin-antitoxin system
LQGAGFPVVRLQDIARRNAPDAEVLPLAAERQLVLLTNGKDFGDILRYPPASHCGIVVLRISAATEVDVHKTLLRLLVDHVPESLGATLAIVSRGKYRLKR